MFRNGGSGIVSVKSRPWVQVWVDGKLVQKETPLREYKVGAGTHQFRFINEAMHFDQTKTVTWTGVATRFVARCHTVRRGLRCSTT